MKNVIIEERNKYHIPILVENTIFQLLKDKPDIYLKEAAELLGMSERTLYRKFNSLKIKREKGVIAKNRRAIDYLKSQGFKIKNPN